MEEDREEAREEEAKKKRQEYANDENDEKEEDNFDWDCDGSTPQERQYLESVLPEEFKYRVNKLNIEETSDVVEETKSRTEFYHKFREKEKERRRKGEGKENESSKR